MLVTYGGRCRIRTYDFHRVNFEVTTLQPFACLAFPRLASDEKAQKPPSFGDELVTSFFPEFFPGMVPMQTLTRTPQRMR